MAGVEKNLPHKEDYGVTDRTKRRQTPGSDGIQPPETPDPPDPKTPDDDDPRRTEREPEEAS